MVTEILVTATIMLSGMVNNTTTYAEMEMDNGYYECEIVDLIDDDVQFSENYFPETKLTPEIGIVQGPWCTETYYNLDMTEVLDIMRDLGYNYGYWIRDDGVKMYGDYVMVAADLNQFPRGTIVETSLGDGIVCDTGEFIYENPYQFDIAVTW